jgi:AhpD family alkylhydroperoxidase
MSAHAHSAEAGGTTKSRLKQAIAHGYMLSPLGG